MKPNLLRAALLGTALSATLAAIPAGAQDANPLSTTDQMLRFLTYHGADSALAIYSVRPDGTPDPAAPRIAWNVDRRMPLGSTFKIVVLAAYAREVAAGRLDPAAPVTVGDWETYYLPETDGGAHPAALAELGIPADVYGFAENPAATVPLDALAHAMIAESDNAATDRLMVELGDGRLRETIAAAGLTGQELPRSILGQFLTWANHEVGSLSPGRVRALLALEPARYAAQVAHWQAKFTEDPVWKAAEFAWLLRGGADTPPELEARVAGARFTHGTVGDYASVMARVVTGRFLSPEISALMKRHLEWPLAIPGLAGPFSAFGNKGGSLLGILTEANFLVAREGDFAGRPRVAVMFQQRIPLPSWDRMTASGIDELFLIRLAVNRAFAERTRRAL